MDEISTEKLAEFIKNEILHSHQVIAQNTSNTGAEISNIKEILKEIRDYQKTQNGNVAKVVGDVRVLQDEKIKIESSFSVAKLIGGIAISFIIILIGIISSVGYYAYAGDVNGIKKDIAKHEETNSVEYQTLIGLLTKNVQAPK